MAILQEYHRPRSAAEAIALLARSEARLVFLAGGTLLVGELETRTAHGVTGVVDLRETGLDKINRREDVVSVGAMCTFSMVAAHPVLSELADGLLKRAAYGEGPLNLRNAATVGGVVACAEYDSELYAALLALDAAVTLYTLEGMKQTLPLRKSSIDGGLIAEVTLSMAKRHGGAARIARTPSDRPIVAAYAAAPFDGDANPEVAICGVGPRPLMAGAPLDPPDDFKGSAEYRLAMSEIVSQRALAQLEKARSHVR